jgi:hypothetical protein
MSDERSEERGTENERVRREKEVQETTPECTSCNRFKTNKAVG